MKTDLAVSAALLAMLTWLEPAFMNGDGLSYAAGVFEPILRGAVAKHALLTPTLWLAYRVLAWAGLTADTIAAFQMFMHACAVGIYLMLARSVYPRFMAGPLTPRACAAGVVVSFGVLSRSCDLEAYAPALFLAVALVAFLLSRDLSRPGNAVAAGLLFLLAVGFHVTNVLLLPLLLAVVWARTAGAARWRSLAIGGATILVGAVAILALLLAHAGAPLWPPNLRLVLPESDPETPQSLASRLARAVYGFTRSVVYLPYIRDLRPAFAAVVGAGLASATAVVVFLARHGLARRLSAPGSRGLLAALALVVGPFAAMGVAYYPSDPERWLFLTPAVWLALGLVWDAYDPPPGARLDHRRAAALLVASVVALGLFNAAFGLLPEARGNRTLNGMKALAGQTRPGDLVVSLSGLTHPVYGFYLGKPLACDNLVFMDLVKRYGADTAALKEAIRAEIRDRLARGGRVLVFGVQGERHVRGEGYPWSHVAHLGIGPETLAEALEPFDPTPLPGTGSDAVSIAALGPRHVPIATRSATLPDRSPWLEMGS